MKFLVFVTALLLLACAEKPSSTAVAPSPVVSVVFLDKSGSMALPAEGRQKYEAALKTLVRENLQRTGDRLELYYLHENPAGGRVGTYRITAQLTAADTLNGSPTDAEAARNTYALAVQQEQQRCLRECVAHLSQTNSGESRKGTAVLASVSVLLELAAKAPSPSRVRACYLSDMIESGTGRDFHRQPPPDAPTAISWAKADAATLAKPATPLERVQLVLPFSPTASSRENNPQVRQYWQTLFNELGVGEVVFE